MAKIPAEFIQPTKPTLADLELARMSDQDIREKSGLGKDAFLQSLSWLLIGLDHAAYLRHSADLLDEDVEGSESSMARFARRLPCGCSLL